MASIVLGSRYEKMCMTCGGEGRAGPHGRYGQSDCPDCLGRGVRVGIETDQREDVMLSALYEVRKRGKALARQPMNGEAQLELCQLRTAVEDALFLVKKAGEA